MGPALFIGAPGRARSPGGGDPASPPIDPPASDKMQPQGYPIRLPSLCGHSLILAHEPPGLDFICGHSPPNSPLVFSLKTI